MSKHGFVIAAALLIFPLVVQAEDTVPLKNATQCLLDFSSGTVTQVDPVNVAVFSGSSSDLHYSSVVKPGETQNVPVGVYNLQAAQSAIFVGSSPADPLSHITSYVLASGDRSLKIAIQLVAPMGNCTKSNPCILPVFPSDARYSQCANV